MRPSRDPKTPKVPLGHRLRSLLPGRTAMAYVFVGAFPPLTAVGVGIELGYGWGIMAAGPAALVVGWLLGAD